ncbi:NAD(P)/FAD-dependent oxidoreductase [Paenibacillus sp. 1P07SE]|uniref:NAD(P)/FAD-dependent oxidoreductase n=1 Tax=Paenibacillus sp. 1P07SE TaxID=3132209 RepID=UPI0039A5C699
MDEVDIAIIGAGIAGSSAAIVLARRGWRTVVIDRQRFPRHKVCGEFLSPEALTMLAELGVLERIYDRGPGIIRQAALTLHGQEELRLALPAAALGISRYFLDSALHRQASDDGARIVTGTTVSAVRSQGDGYTIDTRGSECGGFRARAVISACGSAPGRDLPGGALRDPAGGRLRYLGVKSHYSGMTSGDAVELYFWKGGYVGLAPVEDGIVNVAGLLAHTSAVRERGSVLELLEWACRNNPQLQRRLSGAEPVSGTQAAVSPVPLGKPLTAWQGAALTGDAAIVIPPLCGDGMSIALRTSLLCAAQADAFLSGRISKDIWQRSYEKTVKRQLSRPLRWGRVMQQSLSHPALAPFLAQLARTAPRLASQFVKATRLDPHPSGGGLYG